MSPAAARPPPTTSPRLPRASPRKPASRAIVRNDFADQLDPDFDRGAARFAQPSASSRAALGDHEYRARDGGDWPGAREYEYEYEYGRARYEQQSAPYEYGHQSQQQYSHRRLENERERGYERDEYSRRQPGGGRERLRWRRRER